MWTVFLPVRLPELDVHSRFVARLGNELYKGSPSHTAGTPVSPEDVGRGLGPGRPVSRPEVTRGGMVVWRMKCELGVYAGTSHRGH